VAHDLNNILSGIIGYPDLLLMNLPQDSNIRGSIEAIRESGLRAAEVVADLLTVARGVAAEKIVSNLNVLISEYLQSPECQALRENYPEISLAVDFEQDLLNLECSTVHVKKCLMNLVVNAAEAFMSPGILRISTKNKYLEKPLLHSKPIELGEYVVVTIADSGNGISPEDIAHIFDPFYPKKKMGRSGTGLGLAVVWNTLEDHGGTVVVDSGEEGTTFKLYFPATRKELALSPESMPIDDIKGHGETILVVDDEPQQRDIATKMLTSLHYKVSSVSSGEEAVAYLKDNGVDLVILDMIMDPGLNGRATYEQILTLHPGQKAIIASGFSANAEVKKAQAIGAGQFIKKPYLRNQIGAAVKKALEE
nr:response regulator [Spirochaetales bacterium]